MSAAPEPLLEIKGLEVAFADRRREVRAVRGFDLSVNRGEVVALVGESGSGKSVSMLAVMGLLPPQARIGGSIRFAGDELLGRNERELRQLRGSRIGMVFQDPMASLNPVLTVGFQIAESLQLHGGIGKRAAGERAVELLDRVGIPHPRQRAGQYPHELSGGMRQRVMIAIAIANQPDLLIADEPTTALDVTIQAQVLEVLQEVQAATDTAIVLVTHDLGVVAQAASRVVVMYAGRACEVGPVDEVFERPRHPYTIGLLRSMPDITAAVRAPLHPIGGQPPDLARSVAGCPFHPRCEWAIAACRTELPATTAVADDHEAACHRSAELVGAAPAVRLREVVR